MFLEIFSGTNDTIRELDLEPLQLPRGRRPPARFTGPANPHNASSPEEHFRTKYFSVVDNAAQQLSLLNALTKHRVL